MSVFTVTTLNDENDGINVGGVSLRDAIEAANATPGRDIIRFNAGLSGTIALTYGELTISDSVVIRGLGADTLTIDAGGNSRVFNIDDDSDDESEVTITGVTITGGSAESAGGGIYNAEALRLIDSAIAGNRSSSLDYDLGYRTGFGGGIYNHSGSLLVQNTEISSNSSPNGSGIYTYAGNVRVIDSAITGNTSNSGFFDYGSGGGIYNHSGSLLVQNSEISSNTTNREGGGIHSSNSDVRVIDSEIADNYANFEGGGINISNGNLRLIDSEISGNSVGSIQGEGGGIFTGSSDVRVIDSEISGNSSAGNGGGIYTVSGNVRLIDSEISGNSTEFDGGGIFTSSSDVRLIDTNIADNSAELGVGDIYIGSSQIMSIFTVTTLSDENDGIDVGGVSLRDAIEAANASPGRDVIRFDAGLSGTISLTQGELAIRDSIEIRGLGADTLTIDAGGNSRVFKIDDDSDENHSAVTITGVTITGGYAEYAGGGIYSTEALKVFDSVIANNVAGYFDYFYNDDGIYYYGDGGGIYQSAGSLLVKNSEISNNSSGYFGGGIYASASDVRVIDSDIADNNSEYGGGIYTYDSNVRVINSDIADNSAYNMSGNYYVYSSGGGILAGNSDVRVINSNIVDNRAESKGSGIYSFSSNVRIFDSDIADNSADSEGGGIYASLSNVGVVRSFVTRNSATLGGGLYNSNGDLKIFQSTIDDNTAALSGGGISNNSSLSFDGTTIVNHSSITGNNATDEGGGVFNSGTFRAFNSTIAGNTLGEGEPEFPNEFYGPAGVMVAGTNDDDEIFGGNSDDILKGRHGDDYVVGGAGNDNLFGQTGNDILIGFDPLIGSPGADEIDTLAGGGGRDVFVLGGFFGLESKPTSIPPTGNGLSVAYTAGGDNDYALIKDFTTEETIGLDGHAGLYQLGTASNGLPSGVTISTAEGELIAIVQGEAAIDLNLDSGTGFEFAS